MLVHRVTSWIDKPDAIWSSNPGERIQLQVHVQPGVEKIAKTCENFTLLSDCVHTSPLYHGKLSNERRCLPAIQEHLSSLVAALTDEVDVNHVSVCKEDAHELDLLIHQAKLSHCS